MKKSRCNWNDIKRNHCEKIFYSGDKDEEGDYEKNRETARDSSSDEEEELINDDDIDHNSESEIDCNEESDDDNFESDTDFFIGRDKITKWRKMPYSKTPKAQKKVVSNILPGPQGKAKGTQEEIDTFYCLIDNHMLNEMLANTNMHLEERTAFYSRARSNKQISKNELLALIGLLYLLGTKSGNRTDVRELWATDGTGIQILRACMSSSRFLQLLRAIRFDNKETRAERLKTDKLAPIRSILESFIKNCRDCYNLSEFVTVDEKLEPFRGKCSFIQYMPNKQNRYGLKIFALCDSKSFYTSNIEVYCGAQPEGPYCVSNQPCDIVHRLIEPISGSNRNVTTDNWYTSYELAASLLSQGITTIGMMGQKKQEIPSQFLRKRNRAVESSIFGYQKDATLVSFVPKKNKAVVLLSTMYNDGVIDKKTNTPKILLDYNMSKNGVDMAGHLCRMYSVSRTTRRWPLALFYSLLNVAGLNAYIIYKANKTNQTICRKSFLKNLALQLMKPYLEERSIMLYLPLDIKAFLQCYKPEGKSGILKTEEPSTSARPAKPGRCFECGSKKSRKTKYFCKNCKTYLCLQHITVLCKDCWAVEED